MGTEIFSPCNGMQLYLLRIFLVNFFAGILNINLNT
jgi:hypothetical protein